MLPTSGSQAGSPWPFRSIEKLIPLHDLDLRVLGTTCIWITTGAPLTTLLSPLRNRFIVATRIDTEDTTNVVAVTRNRELTECVPPLAEKPANGLANLVLTILRVMTGSCDGVHGPRRGAVLAKDIFQVRDCLVWVETCLALASVPYIPVSHRLTMKVNVEFAGIGSGVLVTFFIKMTGGFTVCFSHEVVLALTAKAKSFGSTRITPVPSLCGTAKAVRL